MDWANQLPPWLPPLLAALAPLAMQYLHARGYLPFASGLFKWLANAAAQEESKAEDNSLMDLTPKLLAAHASGNAETQAAIASTLRNLWGVAEPVKVEAK